MKKILILSAIFAAVCSEGKIYGGERSKVELRNEIVKHICQRFVSGSCFLYEQWNTWPKEQSECEREVFKVRKTPDEPISKWDFEKCLTEVKAFKQNEKIDCLLINILVDEHASCMIFQPKE